MLERIEKKIDKISEDVVDIKITMARNTESLIIHEKRTSLLEGQLEPIKMHVAMVHGAFKLIGILSVVIAILIGLKALLGV